MEKSDPVITTVKVQEECSQAEADDNRRLGDGEQSSEAQPDAQADKGQQSGDGKQTSEVQPDHKSQNLEERVSALERSSASGLMINKPSEKTEQQEILRQMKQVLVKLESQESEIAQVRQMIETGSKQRGFGPSGLMPVDKEVVVSEGYGRDAADLCICRPSWKHSGPTDIFKWLQADPKLPPYETDFACLQSFASSGCGNNMAVASEESQLPAAVSEQPPLVLHFDINKTIIICDPVKGVGCDGMINSLLSEACWGSWDRNVEIPARAEDKVKLALMAWKLEEGPTVEIQPGMVTYAELLESVLKLEKKQYQKLKTSFTEKGNPGESVRAFYEELQAGMLLPEGMSLPEVPAHVGEGRNFLLPSFLELVLHLHRQKRDFRIIFRTFGVDIMDVIREFNLFCRGQHPCFPDVPADMFSRTIALPAGTGEYFRNSEGFHLAMNSLYSGEELTQIHQGLRECAAELRTKLFQSPQTLSMAIRDCFPYWKKNKEADDSGKPLFVESPVVGSAHQIFFDDNIERDRAHIVDARDIVTGEPLPFSATKGIYLIKAEPMLAIQDRHYFIKAVAQAEMRRAALMRAPESWPPVSHEREPFQVGTETYV